MKRNAIIRIILFSIAIIVLLTILGVGLAAGELMFDDDHSGATTSSSGDVSAAEVRNIDIDWAAGSITIRPTDNSRITFTEVCGENQEAMSWKQSGDTLSIDYHKSNGPHFGNYTGKELVIEVPRDWSCGMLEIDAASADLEVTDLTITKVEFDGASGTCRFDSCRVDSLELDTASGNVYFEGTLDSLDCNAASADCAVTLDNHPSRIEMETASGDLNLVLPADCGFTAEVDVLSGSFSSDFQTSQSGDRHTSGDGAAKITVTALSGNVTIGKK